MTYTNTENYCCDVKEAPRLPEQSMADVMKEVSMLAEQNNLMIHRIRAFLTGGSESCNERTQEPKCFRDELLKARYETRCVNDELGSLAAELGLQ